MLLDGDCQGLTKRAHAGPYQRSNASQPATALRTVATSIDRSYTSAALFAGLVWLAQLAGLHLAAGVRWPVELWTGTVVLTALASGVLGGLAERATTRSVSPSGSVVSITDDRARDVL